MRIFFIILLSLSIWGCSTVEVTKEVIKVTNTVTDKVKKTIPQKKDGEEVFDEIAEEKEIEQEIEIIAEEQKEQRSIIENQQTLAEINFIGNTESKIFNLLGKAELVRTDGSIHMLRYDSSSCRLFLFFNNESNKKRVEYFELRNKKAKLLNSKQSLEQCYREFKLIK